MEEINTPRGIHYNFLQRISDGDPPEFWVRGFLWGGLRFYQIRGSALLGNPLRIAVWIPKKNSRGIARELPREGVGDNISPGVCGAFLPVETAGKHARSVVHVTFVALL